MRGRPKPPGPARPSAGKFDYSMPTDKEPPQGYICYRCGQKGKPIQVSSLQSDIKRLLMYRTLDPGLPGER
jgi:protein MPE1